MAFQRDGKGRWAGFSLPIAQALRYSDEGKQEWTQILVLFISILGVKPNLQLVLVASRQPPPTQFSDNKRVTINLPYVSLEPYVSFGLS